MAGRAGGGVLGAVLVTAPTPEKIQRYEPGLKYIGTGEYVAMLFESDNGEAVLYEGHLRHLKLAQIEVLEEMLADMKTELSDGYETGLEGRWIAFKIAALRLEVDL